MSLSLLQANLCPISLCKAAGFRMLHQTLHRDKASVLVFVDNWQSNQQKNTLHSEFASLLLRSVGSGLKGKRGCPISAKRSQLKQFWCNWSIDRERRALLLSCARSAGVLSWSLQPTTEGLACSVPAGHIFLHGSRRDAQPSLLSPLSAASSEVYSSQKITPEYPRQPECC